MVLAAGPEEAVTPEMKRLVEITRAVAVVVAVAVLEILVNQEEPVLLLADTPAMEQLDIPAIHLSLAGNNGLILNPIMRIAVAVAVMAAAAVTEDATPI